MLFLFLCTEFLYLLIWKRSFSFSLNSQLGWCCCVLYCCSLNEPNFLASVIIKTGNCDHCTARLSQCNLNQLITIWGVQCCVGGKTVSCCTLSTMSSFFVYSIAACLFGFRIAWDVWWFVNKNWSCNLEWIVTKQFFTLEVIFIFAFSCSMSVQIQTVLNHQL